MPITRSTLLGGPAAAVFAGHTYFAQSGILVTPALEIDAVDSDAQGILDATVSNEPVLIKFTPSAPFADLVALYPYTMGEPGMPLFGTADTPLVLIAANGIRLTFSAVAIIELPDLDLTSRGVVAGAVTFLALGARSLPITAANRLVTIDTAAMPAPPATPPQLSDDYQITWGAAPWINLRAMEGVQVKFRMKTKPVLSSANALLDLTLEALDVEVRFVPASPGGLSEADLFASLDLQGAGALPGRLLSEQAATLDIAGDHLYVRLPLARLILGNLKFDARNPRLGELVFTAGRASLATGENAAELIGPSEGAPV